MIRGNPNTVLWIIVLTIMLSMVAFDIILGLSTVQTSIVLLSTSGMLLLFYNIQSSSGASNSSWFKAVVVEKNLSDFIDFIRNNETQMSEIALSISGEENIDETKVRCALNNFKSAKRSILFRLVYGANVFDRKLGKQIAERLDKLEDSVTLATVDLIDRKAARNPFDIIFGEAQKDIVKALYDWDRQVCYGYRDLILKKKNDDA